MEDCCFGLKGDVKLEREKGRTRDRWGRDGKNTCFFKKAPGVKKKQKSRGTIFVNR